EHGLKRGRQRIRQLIELGKLYEREHGLRPAPRRRGRLSRARRDELLATLLECLVRLARPSFPAELTRLAEALQRAEKKGAAGATRPQSLPSRPGGPIRRAGSLSVRRTAESQSGNPSWVGGDKRTAEKSHRPRSLRRMAEGEFLHTFGKRQDRDFAESTVTAHPQPGPSSVGHRF